MASELERASAGPAALRAAIEAQLLCAVARGAEIVDTPAFRVHLWRTPDPFYRNVAVPTRRPVDWRPAIAAMQAAFAAAGCVVRLEFLDERWPDLALELDAAGLIETALLEVMVATERPPVALDGVAVQLLDALLQPAVVEAYLVAVHRAFQQPLDPRSLPSEVARLQAAIAQDGCRIATIRGADGSFLAGASLIGISRGGAGRIAELAGVWTAPSERGRGLARRVVAAVVDQLVAQGDGIVWLAAENARTRALYARVGFRPIGWQRNYSARAA
jgi:RimJ/RimL family protein N-acetyltransferase